MPYELKAMVADDDDHVRTYLLVLLRKFIAGTIIEARNGVEAIAVYERERPDLVLLDVNMPVMDGLDALSRIREINPAAVVIMLTSLAMRRIVDAALQGGATQFLRKDTPRDQVVEIVKETIEAFILPPVATPEATTCHPLSHE